MLRERSRSSDSTKSKKEWRMIFSWKFAHRLQQRLFSIPSFSAFEETRILRGSWEGFKSSDDGDCSSAGEACSQPHTGQEVIVGGVVTSDGSSCAEGCSLFLGGVAVWVHTGAGTADGCWRIAE